MLIKKFQAENMPEALKLVKAEFGLDAMILNSREERRKGLMGFFRKSYVEVTAAIGKPTAERSASTAAPVEGPVTTRDEFRNAMLEPLVREIKQLRDKVEVLYEKKADDMKMARPVPGNGGMEQEVLPAEAAGNAKPHAFETIQWRAGEIRNDLQQEEAILPPQAGGKKGAKTQQTVLGAFSEELRQNGVDTEIAGTLLERIASLIGRKRKGSDIGKGLEQALESMVDFTCEAGSGKDGQRVIALVGPTGVGKTTTIVKMALAAAKQGKKVAIVTSDKMKPGDAEHLKRCAGTADIIIDSATTPQKLGRALKNLRERDIVLIDTSGVSPRDQEGMEHLEKLLAASPSIEKHLCLSSTTRDRELSETVRRFGRYAIDRLIFTRLDESETFGSIINVLLRSNLPPSFLTTGQKAHGNIEIATAGRLAELAVGGR